MRYISKTPITPEIEKLIILRHIVENRSIFHIKRETGLHSATISKILIKNGHRPKTKQQMKDEENQKIEQQIIDEYLSIPILGHVSTKFQLSKRYIKKILIKNNVTLRETSGISKIEYIQGLKPKIIKDYNERKSQTYIINNYRISVQSLKKILSEAEIHVRPQLIYKLDKNYFNEINTFYKAYFLGLILSDGCLSKARAKIGKFTISLQERDGYLLHKLAEELKSDKPLKLRDKGAGRQKQWSISICNSELIQDLQKLGLGPAKSFNATININMIPQKFHFAFLLGIFDGDGCVTFASGNYSAGKGIRFQQTKFYAGWIGSFQTVEIIKNILDYQEIKYNIQIKQYRNGQLKWIKIANKAGFKKLYDLFYSDAPIYLKRKKEKFEEIFKLIS